MVTALQRESSYPECKKDFYSAAIPPVSDALTQWMGENRIEVHNLTKPSSIPLKSPSPCLDFSTMPIPPKLVSYLQSHDYARPTPIQSVAIPFALAGRDIIGSSPTGSGKTLCYIVPLIVHTLGQSYALHSPLKTRYVKEAEGPIAIVMVPTRELAEQIAAVAKPFFSLFDLSLLCITGGQSEWEQKKALFNHHYHCVIGTPGRLIEIINEKYLPLKWCSFIVLDEADRMVSMGFEKQIRSILSVVREDCQRLLFSATFPPRIVRLAMDLMHGAARLAVGRAGLANTAIEQELLVLRVDSLSFC